jgi:UDP-N-acetyl-2-amino-2-deoxyglucuronate dehydrogenase
MREFVLLGAAGFVAPRHLSAIHSVGGVLSAAFDPSDSVGILDSLFPEATYLREESEVETFLSTPKLETCLARYVVVCSPTHLHRRHIAMALSHHWDVICEKPIVLNMDEYLEVVEMERTSLSTVWPILQMRYHPSLVALRQRVQSEQNRRYQVDLAYIAPRGDWYKKSWKGQKELSGGIALNIGIHLFDLLIWIFGAADRVEVQRLNWNSIAGRFDLQRATVNWKLSVSGADHPDFGSVGPLRAHRQMFVDSDLVDFSDISGLHLAAYQAIEEHRGCRLSDARASLELASEVARVAGASVTLGDLP